MINNYLQHNKYNGNDYILHNKFIAYFGLGQQEQQEADIAAVESPLDPVDKEDSALALGFANKHR